MSLVTVKRIVTCTHSTTRKTLLSMDMTSLPGLDVESLLDGILLDGSSTLVWSSPVSQPFLPAKEPMPSPSPRKFKYRRSLVVGMHIFRCKAWNRGISWPSSSSRITWLAFLGCSDEDESLDASLEVAEPRESLSSTVDPRLVALSVPLWICVKSRSNGTLLRLKS